MGTCYFACCILVHIRPSTYHKYSSFQLVYGHQPNIYHLRIFGCVVYVFVPSQNTKMSPQRRLGIYVGFDCLSIIKYLKHMMDDIFVARFVGCSF